MTLGIVECMLAVDAIHPGLVGLYSRLKDIADKRSGLLGGYSVLGTYLATQLEVLKLCDVMFASDFAGDSERLIRYSVGESQELAEVLPIFNPSASEYVNGKASDEAGDVAWFLAMRVGLAQLNPEEHKMTSDEINFVVGMMKIFDGVATIYPNFNPETHAEKVATKVGMNYGHRTLRASPTMSIREMSNEFTTVRALKIRALRKELPGEKIPRVVFDALRAADEHMPVVEFATEHAANRYREVLVYAKDASNYYAY